MSTIKVTNIQDTAGSNSSTSAEIYSGRAKVWVNFKGNGTVSIRQDFNVNTITDNGNGEYVINFSNALSDSGYCAVLGVGRADADRVMPYYGEYSSSSPVDGPEDSGGGSKTTSALKVRIGFAQNATYDIGSVSCAIFR